MHETFCYWDLAEWEEALKTVGFLIHPDSHAIANPWIVTNRLEGKVRPLESSDGDLSVIPWPVTGMLLLGKKPKIEG